MSGAPQSSVAPGAAGPHGVHTMDSSPKCVARTEGAEGVGAPVRGVATGQASTRLDDDLVEVRHLGVYAPTAAR